MVARADQLEHGNALSPAGRCRPSAESSSRPRRNPHSSRSKRRSLSKVIWFTGEDLGHATTIAENDVAADQAVDQLPHHPRCRCHSRAAAQRMCQPPAPSRAILESAALDSVNNRAGRGTLDRRQPVLGPIAFERASVRHNSSPPLPAQQPEPSCSTASRRRSPITDQDCGLFWLSYSGKSVGSLSEARRTAELICKGEQGDRPQLQPF
jgi:hypothetical protein